MCPPHGNAVLSVAKTYSSPRLVVVYVHELSSCSASNQIVGMAAFSFSDVNKVLGKPKQIEPFRLFIIVC